jgi:putative sigma-54 modulation protein
VALHAHGTNLISREESGDMMTSIDRVIDRVERQIKKLSAKIKVRGRKERRVPLREVTAGVGVVAEDRAIEEDAEEDVEEEGEEEEEFCPVVVQGVQYHPQPVTVEEAIQVMRDKDWDFILFNNAKTDKMSLLHIREDGNFGFVEPS